MPIGRTRPQHAPRRHGLRDHQGDRGGDAKEGRTDSFIHRKFTMLRMLVSYGKLIKAEGARICATHCPRYASGRPPSGHRRPRGNRSTPSQRVEGRSAALRGRMRPDLRDGAESGRRARPVAPHRRERGGIVRNGQRWQDGLTWDCFAPDFWSFSRSSQDREDDARSDRVLPALAPLLRRRLMALAAPESRVGPVFVISKGMTPECPTCPVDGPLRGAGSRARQAYRIACG